MKINILLGTVCVVVAGATYYFYEQLTRDLLADTEKTTAEAATSFTATEAGFDEVPTTSVHEYMVGRGVGYTLSELQNWQREAGPLRVGIQSGHWRNDEVPEELKALERNGGGAQFGTLTEREVVYKISELVAADLEAAGIEVDILPATVPPGYLADAFVSIHADGSTSGAVSGHKHAGPRRDYSGLSERLVDIMYEEYGNATGMKVDPSVTNRMTAYYAFNWPRYEHAIHPLTPAVIVETGFLTNASDRAIIVATPERSALGIANAIKRFLETERIPKVPAQFALAVPSLPLTGEVICAPLRTERILRGQTNDTCEVSLKADDGSIYLLDLPVEVSTSTLPTRITVEGDFVPLQTLDTYFWFRYDVAGIIRVRSISQ